MRSAACVILVALGLFVGCGAEPRRAQVSSPALAGASPPASEALDSATASRDVAIRTPEPPSGSSAEREAATMQTVEAAWKTHDADKLGSAYAVTARVIFSGYPETNGRQAIEEAARSFWTSFPDAKHAWSREWRAAGVAIVESAWTGTNTGALPGAKPTRATAGGVALTLSWFAPDGLIREQHIYSDTGAVATQLGLSHATKVRPFEGLPTSREQYSEDRTVMEQENVEKVNEGLRRETRGDAKRFLSWIAEDAEYVDFTQPAAWKGKGGIEKWLHALRSVPSDSVEVATNTWGIADYVIREYAADPFEVDDLAGKSHAHPARASEHHRTSGSEVFQLRDGKLVRAWGYANTLEPAVTSSRAATF
jgi:ketosteroid isomerase-like protein